MPLKKLPFTPGINREQTRYSTEGGWYDGDKIRFRQSLPEKIGGWTRASVYTFLGTCRSLFSWITLGGQELRGIGTHLKYYIEKGGEFFDITPIRSTTAAGDVTFSASNGSDVITVSDTAHGATAGSYVTFSGAASLGGNIIADVLNQEYAIATVIDADSYTILAVDTSGNTVTANASDTGNGGASVVGAYQVNIGNEISVPQVGWGAGLWNTGVWGTGTEGSSIIRVWNHSNFGEDLIFGPRYGGLYYWDNSTGVTTRGVRLDSLGGASEVPEIHLHVLVSDQSRFVFAFGCDDYGSSELDPLLIRWSDQENAVNWTPAATNQAGSLRLSRGSRIVAVKQARQEILVWTDTTLYSLQYVGAPIVWSTQVVGENISIVNDRCVTYSAGVAYWMGSGVFYMYDGRTQPLKCDVRRYVFNDLNTSQADQIFSGTNEQFYEVWWFYPCTCGNEVDKYVIYNFRENIWYYGNMSRTAWRDNAWSGQPLAATYNNRLVVHEIGVDDDETGDPQPISAYILSSEFDIDDGHRYAFMWRLMPDITFEGSTSVSPTATFTLYPLKGSGSGYRDPLSVGGNDNQDVVRSVSVPVEVYTNQLNIRVRGRQLAVKIESDALGTQWQLGTPRLDLRPDGRR